MSSQANAEIEKLESRLQAWCREQGSLAEESPLIRFFTSQRWYPAKNAVALSAEISIYLPVSLAAGPAGVVLWHVSLQDGASLELFVPVALVPENLADASATIDVLSDRNSTSTQSAVIEGFSSDSFVQAWLKLFFDGPDPALSGLRRGRNPNVAGKDFTQNGAVRRLSGEQSNTSIQIGTEAILKVIRKPEVGTTLEVEVGEFFRRHANFGSTPTVLGWIELGNGAADLRTLSILQSFVQNDGDGWHWVLERLRSSWLDGGSPPPDVREWFARLGNRTAEMHRAFAAPDEDEAFQPQPITPDDLADWSENAISLGRRVIERLEAAGDNLPLDAREAAAQIRSSASAIFAQLTLAFDPHHAFVKTRLHGDYHLGQVLVAGGDAVIIDFEGEPLRPLSERRAKHSVLRDIAGMLRSIAYASGAVQKQIAVERTASVDEFFHRWERDAAGAFLESYFQTVHGVASVPADRDSADSLIRFFTLEKTLYEIGYELANRPGWVGIPLRGLLNAIDRPVASRRHDMPFGAEVRFGQSVRFCLWSPEHPHIRLEIDGNPTLLDMASSESGWHQVITEQAKPGTRYRFVLPNGKSVPDPASRYQPEDVHGPSEVIDPGAYCWRDGSWVGRPWIEAVLYELHVGTFTPEGTFRAIIEKLDHLVALGITAIELMPIADFPGTRNWGYDGVLPYAPDSAYGRPEDLKALVDAAHSRGIMVILDVVYNHFGPDGAYFHDIAPSVWTDRHHTPWGGAINFDGAGSTEVREFFIHNALYWIEEYHLDGLRLDAVHAIIDESPVHVLTELAERVRSTSGSRDIHLILENEDNQAQRLVRSPTRSPYWYSAQWNDDVHHVLHVAVTGESSGYYADYSDNTNLLGRALAEGFAYQGEAMPYRGSPRGEPSSWLPPAAFVSFIQNHDQVGNRAFGDRITSAASPQAVRAIAATYLLLPQIPMLFMGEEWAAAQPFPFFCAFEGELAKAVRDGRRQEFARFPEFSDPATREKIPDPTAEETFRSAKLVWSDITKDEHRHWLEWYRRVLEIRHAQVVPLLSYIRTAGRYRVIGKNAVTVRWRVESSNTELVLEANFSPHPMSGFEPIMGQTIWQEGDAAKPGVLEPWSIRWTLCAVEAS